MVSDSGAKKVVLLKKASQHPEIIVRAIIKNQNTILLCKSVSKKHAYLPGGHVEVGETPEEAMLREIDEELGVPIKIQKKLGILENRWKEGGEWIHELSIIFVASSTKIETKKNPMAKEKNLQFFWNSPETLEKAGFRPRSFIPHLSSWLSEEDKLHFLSLSVAE